MPETDSVLLFLPNMPVCCHFAQSLYSADCGFTKRYILCDEISADSGFSRGNTAVKKSFAVSVQKMLKTFSNIVQIYYNNQAKAEKRRVMG